MSAAPIRIAIAGMGKIARDQHVPAIAGSADFRLAATIDPAGSGADGVPWFASVEAFLASGVGADALAVCTPPQMRHAVADAALAAGLHVLLEKPPAACLSEAAALEARADAAAVTLFAAWHSRFAPGVAPAREWLRGKRILRADIAWREDVRHWHPGQEWIFGAGGLGVFDPGINALSILTELVPDPILLTGGTLSIPENRAAPTAATLAMRSNAGAPIAVDLDFLQTGPQTWDLAIETDAGRLLLQMGGAILALPDGTRIESENREYAGVYARFAELVRAGASEVDCTPLRLAADAFLRCEPVRVESFEF